MYVKSLNILIRTKYSASIPSAEFCEKHVFLSLSKSSLSLHYSWLTAIRDDASVAGLLWSQHQFILSASYISDIGNHKTRNYTTITIDYGNPPALP